MSERILLTGATGFIGQHLHPALVKAGHRVRCLTRSPDPSRARWPDRDWVGGDVGDPGSLARAMEGCSTAYYLVHGMAAARPGWAGAELRWAGDFAEAAGQAGGAWWDLPGPEALSGKEILLRVAAVMGRRPVLLEVPLVTPRLSSHWIRLVTRADFGLARELVEGLTSDLLATRPGYWTAAGLPAPIALEEAARRALAAEAGTVALRGRFAEALAGLLTRRT